MVPVLNVENALYLDMVSTEPSKYTALGVECRKRPLFVLNFVLAAVSKSILGQCQNLSLLKIARYNDIITVAKVIPKLTNNTQYL